MCIKYTITRVDHITNQAVNMYIILLYFNGLLNMTSDVTNFETMSRYKTKNSRVDRMI